MTPHPHTLPNGPCPGARTFGITVRNCVRCGALLSNHDYEGIPMTTAHSVDLDTELEQYISTALWSTNADHLDPEGTGEAGALEDHFSPEDLSPEARESMRADLADFLHHADPRALDFWVSELGAGQIGHDFWLTRNGHGAGFWDRFGAGIGQSFGNHLTEKAKPYSESNVYAGDDGRLYVA